MPRLYRPSISVEIRCRVVLRQLGELFIDDVIRANRFVPRVSSPRSLGRLLADRLPKLAELLGCAVKDLRLDHDPALENRMKLLREYSGTVSRTKWVMVVPDGADVIKYDPPANSLDHLRYRPHAAEFDGSHHIKTNVRGDNGQFPDNTIAKRERRRQKKAKKTQCSRCFARYRIPPSKLCGRCQKVAMKYRDKVKRKWPKRPFQTRSAR